MGKHQTSSYTQILKSSAIVGGAQAIEILIRMIRVKVVAMLLGPSGVGLIGIFQSTIEFVQKLSGLGISSSGIRQVAEAQGSGDFDRLGRTVKILMRACLITGIFGWLITLILAQYLSIWTFGNSERAWAFSILGSVVLINIFFEGQKALLQGTRRIKDLAQVMVFSAAVGTIISVILYAWLGEAGILIALPAVAAINLAFSWWFAHRVALPKVVMNLRETIKEAYPMIALGLAFMWAGILTAGVAFMTRSLIIRGLGIDAAGIYQAAWGISGLFAGFILNAMGKDFYPRLTAVADKNDRVNQFVNEQIEVGVLIALPGLLATLAFSPWVIQIFYTAKFMQASEMLPWFVLGVFGRIISWPMGFIQMAKGASVTFAITETVSNLLHLLFVWLGLRYIGLLGVAFAFAVLYIFYSALMYCVAIRLSGFRWSRTVILLIGFSVLFIGLEFGILHLLQGVPAAIVSLILVAGSGIYSLRQLTVRLGPEHRISKLVATIPGVKLIFKTKKF